VSLAHVWLWTLLQEEAIEEIEMEDGKEEDVKAEEAGPPKVKRWANLHPKIRSHTLQQLGIFAGNGIKGASNRGEEKGGRGGGGGGAL